MYAAVVSSAVVAGLVAAGATLPGTDRADEQESVRVVACTQAAYLYAPMDAAERHSCQSTYTPYVPFGN